MSLELFAAGSRRPARTHPVALPAGEHYRRGNEEAEDLRMIWTTPQVIEIAVGMEINAYACAEL